MNPQSNPIRRDDRRRRKTRIALMDAGQRLFAKRPIDSVSIDEIVDAADVAKGSFYNHFDDKEHLATAIVELVQGDREFHIFAANRDVDDPAERVARALCVTLGYAVAHPERIQALVSLTERRTVAGTPLNVGVTADMSAGIERGRFSGITLEGAILVAMGLIGITTTHACTEETSASVPDLAAMIGRSMLRALGLNDAEAEAVARDAADNLLSGRTPR
jgi:AcrR family transcriptional regulator